MKTLQIIALTLIATCYIQAQNQVLLLDDFSANDRPSHANLTKMAFNSEYPGAEISLQIEQQASEAPFLSLTYDVSNPNSFCGLAYGIESEIDLSAYKYFSLKVNKGSNQVFRIQFKTLKENIYISSEDFIHSHMENDWQTVLIPMENILIDFSSLTEIVIVFEHTISVINQSAFSGTVFLDDLTLGTADPGEFNIDRMNDLIGENATGGLTGIFTQYEQYAGDYGLTFGDTLIIEYDNTNQSFGGAYWLFGMEGNSLGVDASLYEVLEIELTAPANLNPGNVKLELKNDTETGYYRLTNIESDIFRRYCIPLSDFSDLPANFTSFVVVFEKNINDRIAGELKITDISLLKETYFNPDTIVPRVTLMQNNEIVISNAYLVQDKGPVVVTADSTTSTLLESVELYIKSQESTRLVEKKIVNETMSFLLPKNMAPSSSFIVKTIYYNGFTFEVEKRGVIPFGVETVFYDAFKFMDAARNVNHGLYIDALLLDGGAPFHPFSTGATGMAIYALICESESLEFSTKDEITISFVRQDIVDKIILTLKTVLGLTHGYYPQRTENGFLYHWMNQNGDSLKQAWSSEVSTIDMALLVSSALFANNYFDDALLNTLAYELIINTDFSAALRTSDKKIYRELEYPSGNPIPGSISSLFNEYYLILELAAVRELLIAQRDGEDAANREILDLFEYYQEMENYPKVKYNEIELLTDQPGYISHFIYQFVYYLSHSYSTSLSYQAYLINALKADSTFFASHGSDYFGLGAGVMPQGGYEATSLSNNDKLIFNPAQLIGYMPAVEDKEYICDLVEKLIWQGGYLETPYGIILPRQSVHQDYTDWKGTELALVDYVTTIFGWSSNIFKEDFFQLYNNYDYDHWAFGNTEIKENRNLPVKVYPNPARQQIIVESSSVINDLKVYSITGRCVNSIDLRPGSQIIIEFSEPGTYLIRYRFINDYHFEKIVVL